MRGGRGRYRRVKDVLERRGRIQLWYDFEARRQRALVKEWLDENGVTLK